MNKETVSVSVRHLAVGDVLTGSGFTVTRAPYTSVRCPKGRLWVEGVTSKGVATTKLWNASTTMRVAR